MSAGHGRNRIISSIRYASVVIMFCAVAGLFPSSCVSAGPVTFTALFNNVPSVPGLATGWGYACLIEDLEKTVLFDTGADGERLLANMRSLGKDPRNVDIVVISHIHHDHRGGLETFLGENPHVTVAVPASFPPSLTESIRRQAAGLVAVTGPRTLAPSIMTTGEMGRSTVEQALVVKTGRGLVVVTGCAHPGVVTMVRRAKVLYKDSISCVMGGFHLIGRDDGSIRRVINGLKSLKVISVAPSHCTGDRARALFREAWGPRFIDGGLGAAVVIDGQ